MPSFYGNMMGTSGIPKTKGLNRVQSFHAVPEYVADQGYVISGITKDSTGAVLVSVTVELFNTLTDTIEAQTVSDSVTGAYIFYVTPGVTKYAVAYKAGAPDVAGTTTNTLVGV